LEQAVTGCKKAGADKILSLQHHAKHHFSLKTRYVFKQSIFLQRFENKSVTACLIIQIDPAILANLLICSDLN